MGRGLSGATSPLPPLANPVMFANKLGHTKFAATELCGCPSGGGGGGVAVQPAGASATWAIARFAQCVPDTCALQRRTLHGGGPGALDVRASPDAASVPK